MLLSLMLGLYMSVIVCFSFVSHPIYYCLLLLISSLSVCGVVYCFLGFGWYLILFALVYVGGIYILFLFVSVFSPNFLVGYTLGLGPFLGVFFFAVVIFFSLFNLQSFVVEESSHYLCSFMEGFSYLIFCLVLVLGFLCVSIVVNRKDSFYR